MLTVISFAERLKAKPFKTELLGPAEIIIFPGVRFERLEFTKPSDRQSRRLPAMNNQATAEDLE